MPVIPPCFFVSSFWGVLYQARLFLWAGIEILRGAWFVLNSCLMVLCLSQLFGQFFLNFGQTNLSVPNLPASIKQRGQLPKSWPLCFSQVYQALGPGTIGIDLTEKR